VHSLYHCVSAAYLIGDPARVPGSALSFPLLVLPLMPLALPAAAALAVARAAAVAAVEVTSSLASAAASLARSNRMARPHCEQEVLPLLSLVPQAPQMR
jgi:hypothetical protein